MLHIEILATGNEICTGDLVDTNSAYIANSLRQLGLQVSRIQCVRDDLSALVSILQEIGGRAELVIVTGGLGPTLDDFSAEAAAKASNKKLEVNQKAHERLSQFLNARNRSMSASNKKQTYFPQDSICLDNKLGTAPGFQCNINKATFFFLPGVPREMEAMLAEHVLPYIQQHYPQTDYVAQRVFSLFGLSEAQVNDALLEVQSICPHVQLGTRAAVPEIQIKLYAQAADQAQAEACLDDASDYLFNRLGHWIFSSDGQGIEAVVGALLLKHGSTLAVAESCTGGLIADKLTNVSGSSNYFLLSAVTYANEAKTEILDVSEDTLVRYGAVSLETVQEMAANVRQKMHADYGLATSGIAGPDGGSDEKPVGTVWIGLATETGVEAYRYYFPYGNRMTKKKLFAMAALDLLRRKLMSLPLLAQT